MRRREFVALLGSASVIGPLPARGQQVSGIFHVGLIAPSTPVALMSGPNPLHASTKAFLHGLRDLGYLEGTNLVLERRSAEGRFERFDEIVTELVARNTDVIVTIGNEMAQSARRVTTKVPIVMANSVDPVAAGIVASLARPGRNITGLSVDTGPEFEAKRLQLLTEAVPGVTQIAFLGTKEEWESQQGASVRNTAQILGVTLVHAECTPSDYAAAFAAMIRDRPQALFLSRHAAHIGNQKLIADYVTDHNLPGMFHYREFVDAGGLLSYGVNLSDLFRRAASYVDKILKGAKPDDLPVQQPTKFELVINLRAAKALGVVVPPLMLAQADEAIE